MAVESTVIAAYKRLYSKAQLEAALRQALDDRASGVMVTQVNFQDGGGSGQIIKGDPNELIIILELALRSVDNADLQVTPPLASSVNFSGRRVET